MDAYEYLVARHRLCDHYILCIDCPFDSGKCIMLEVEEKTPELAIHAVEKFVEDHEPKV